MPKKVLKDFKIEYLQILDENGNCDEALMPRLSNDEIKKIYETGIAQEWTEGDMLFLRKKGTGKKLFVVRSKEKKIVLEFYKPMVEFRKKIAARLNLEVGSQYNAAWDFIVNG